MATRSVSTMLTTFTLVYLVMVVPLEATQASSVGRRMKINDVKANKEVQELGKYSVKEYNRSHRRRPQQDGDGDLLFTEVVEAEKQVVSGVNYYLKISAAARNAVPKTFDAVVAVKPWVRSKELLSFSPSSKSS